MAYAEVCRLEDLADNKPHQLTVDGFDLAVVKVDDAVYAVDDLCTHAAVSLSEGDVEDCRIECWMHGSMFDLRTGEPSGPPATEPVATYATKVEDGAVLVDIDQQTNDA